MTKTWDLFMFRDELDLLECRLTELDRAVYRHVIVEADTDHQGHPKPLYFAENAERFAPWHDRLVHVVATGLPTPEEDRDAWSREHAQREAFSLGLKEADWDDIILQSDIDEIPTAMHARNVRPQPGELAVGFSQKLYCFAVDWQHPDPWSGTVAMRARNITSFAAMRDLRGFIEGMPEAGWHLSWLGDTKAQEGKHGAFCHPEIECPTCGDVHIGGPSGAAQRRDCGGDPSVPGIRSNFYQREGWHVDGTKLIPVDVDRSWPRYIYERRCPANWFRPRSD